MAINTPTIEWDEDAINALYRSWQQTRDGVDYRHYRPIMQAAREMAKQDSHTRAETAARMDVIRVAAREQILDQRLPAVEHDRERTPQQAPGQTNGLQSRVDAVKSTLFSAVADFIDSISPRQWIPVAVTAALVVAIVPFVVDTESGSSYHRNLTAQTEVLSAQGGLVATELDRLEDFQLGFSSGTGEYAKAFGAGVMFSNLVSLTNATASDQHQKSLVALENLTGQELGDSRSVSPTETGDRLQEYYSRDGYWSVFVFGQWVETGYLLSRMALAGTDKAAANAALIRLLADKPEIVDLLSQSGHYDARLDSDLDRLGMAVADGELEAGELRAVSNMLLKLRTVESAR